MIATFPSCNYNIDEYPAIKKFLMSFDVRKLEQSGKEFYINGEKVKSRKKTNNKWFETQDCINYMDDFNKPKIVWTAVNSEYKFALLPKNMLINNSLFMITGKNIEYLCAILNSKLFRYYMYLTINNGSYTYGSKELIENIFIKEVSNDIVNLINKYLINKEYEKIDTIVFKIYSINEKEINYINSKIK